MIEQEQKSIQIELIKNENEDEIKKIFSARSTYKSKSVVSNSIDDVDTMEILREKLVMCKAIM